MIDRLWTLQQYHGGADIREMDITRAASGRTADDKSSCATPDALPTPAIQAVSGIGASVVFLHGWGVAGRTYRTALKQLERRGLRVHAPAMPGFGGTTALPAHRCTLHGYASWASDYIGSLGAGPVVLIGHSLGGGVAAMTAYRSPELVSQLILVNGIGGAVWRTTSDGSTVPLANRPLWDWMLRLPQDLLAPRELARVLPLVLRDSVPAAMLNPTAFWRAGRVARTADLTYELAELGYRGLPVTVISSSDDAVVPAAATAALCAAHADIRSVTVTGGHSWLLADPHRFGRIVHQAMAGPHRDRSDRAAHTRSTAS